MNRTRIFAALGVAASLGAATAVANGSEPDPAQAPAQAAVAPGVPMTPVWVQLPAAGSYPYYLMTPQPVPPLPLPQMTLPPGWGPFVMVWVPVQALQAWPVPPVVDYGPVMDTPVVVLPEPGSAPVSDEAAESQPAATLPAQAAVPATGPAPSAPAEVPLSEIDYGPIAPTPVVELPDFSAPPAVVAPAKPAAKARKKPVSKKKPVQKAPAAAAPAKKRMCWTNGVVEPCR